VSGPADEEFGEFMRGRWPAMVRLAYALTGDLGHGVASVAVRLSDGKTVTATPVPVGNERLFAFPVSLGISPTGWTAYSSSGAVVQQARF